MTCHKVRELKRFKNEDFKITDTSNNDNLISITMTNNHININHNSNKRQQQTATTITTTPTNLTVKRPSILATGTGVRVVPLAPFPPDPSPPSPVPLRACPAPGALSADGGTEREVAGENNVASEIPVDLGEDVHVYNIFCPERQPRHFNKTTTVT